MQRASLGLVAIWVAIWGALVLGGCTAGSSGTGNGDDDDDNDASGGSAGFDPGTGGISLDGGPGGSSGEDCSEASKLVYVIDSNNKLYSFDPSIPNVGAFQWVGDLSCPGDGPNSMSVSRDGHAYVLYGNADIWAPGGFQCVGVHKVTIDTAAFVQQTPFVCGSSGFNKFGMGYATNGPETIDETLFIGNSLQADLATLDVATGAVVVQGAMPNQGPEFTGNALGELWGFFPYDIPPTAKHIDKNSGAALETLVLSSLPDVGSALLSAAWAFAYWGGSFYIFYMVEPPDTSTYVYKLEYDGTLTTYIPNTGLRIVGAGVSTCAPIVPPN